MINVLIFLGCAMNYWGNTTSGLGPTLQPLYLFFFFCAAALAALQGRVAPIRITVQEWILFGACILSATVALCRSLEYCMQYSMVFFSTLILMSIIVRAVPLEKILDITAAVLLLLVLSTVIFERSNFLKALSISTSREGLFRFTPFKNHPNLTGFIFGAGSLLLARRVIVARNIAERATMMAATVLAWAIVVSASARASVVALIFAAIVTVSKEWRPTRATFLKVLGGVSVLVVGLITVLGSSAFNYLGRILEVNSRTRGIGSGATGRTGVWSGSLELLFSDPLRLLFGGSMRSSDISIIGFDVTEDAYIPILLDSGLFVGVAIIAIFLVSPFTAASLSGSSEYYRRQLVILPAFFAFLLIESVFNRYLLAVGNPMSLIVLLITMSLAVRSSASGKLTAREA